MTASLRDRRIMVVEDEALVAMMTCDYLEEMGCIVVGPFPTVERAMTALENEDIDGAVLDVNLGNGLNSLPVAIALNRKSTPFILATGYGAGGVPSGFPVAPVLAKPFNEQQLATALVALLAPA